MVVVVLWTAAWEVCYLNIGYWLIIMYVFFGVLGCVFAPYRYRPIVTGVLLLARASLFHAFLLRCWVSSRGLRIVRGIGQCDEYT